MSTKPAAKIAKVIRRFMNPASCQCEKEYSW